MTLLPTDSRAASAVLALSLLAWGCGSQQPPDHYQGPSTGVRGGATGAGGVPGAGGAGMQPTPGGAAGSAAAASPDGGGSQTTAGGGGAAGAAGTDGMAGAEPDGDTPAPRPLDVQAAPGEHVHNVNGHAAGLNNAVPKLMGKLIVQLDDSLYQFGLKRGFHVLGVNLPICPINYETREHNGDCRLEVFDAVDRDPSMTVTPEQSVTGQVTSALESLRETYPEEDWGYYLNADGSVRWSDVGFTGHSHRAQSATRFAVAMRVYRAVARSGPRDCNCAVGDGTAMGKDFDPDSPPYDPNCPAAKISAWLDETPKTPVDRFFGFVGKTDPEYGDIQFSMERLHLPGKPVNVSTAAAPYAGSHRFYADAGHDGFDGKAYWDALDIAWGVPAENAAWAPSH